MDTHTHTHIHKRVLYIGHEVVRATYNGAGFQSYEEEDTCMSYEEEDTCHTYI